MTSKHTESGNPKVVKPKFLCSKSEQRSKQLFSENVRKSLQTCRADENEDKLQGFLDMYKKKKCHHKTSVIEALLFILRQLLASSSSTDARGRGFLEFEEALGLYSSFFEKPLERQQFRDQLLHQDYGLRVFIATIQSTR